MSRENLFDELARNLASPMPRRRALQRLLGGIAGVALASIVRPGTALAADPTPVNGVCPQDFTNCGNAVCCPPARTCCGTVCCQAGEVCVGGTRCKKLASPSSPGSGTGR